VARRAGRHRRRASRPPRRRRHRQHARPGGAKLIAGIIPAAPAAQPLTVEQAGTGQLNAQASPPEAADRLSVQIFDGLIAAQQCT
jgi:hypothetical protein